MASRRHEPGAHPAGDKTLEKIARYEAHLSRQLYQACTSSRTSRSTGTTGEGVPLARLDVHGLSVD
jgi:hypothetical protein